MYCHEGGRNPAEMPLLVILDSYNVVPPSYKLVYNPINQRYIYHQS